MVDPDPTQHWEWSAVEVVPYATAEDGEEEFVKISLLILSMIVSHWEQITRFIIILLSDIPLKSSRN